MDRLPYVRAQISLHWGFSVRPSLITKSKPSSLFPPPTTFIGALGYGLARLRGLPEETLSNDLFVSIAEAVRSRLQSVNVRALGPFTSYSDLTRVWWRDVRRKQVKFDAVALGKTYGASSSFDVVFLFKPRISEDEMKNFVAAACGVVRIGSREGIACVDEVSFGFADPLTEKEVETRFSFSLEDARLLRGEYVMISSADYLLSSIGDYSRAHKAVYVYPYHAEELRPTAVFASVRDGASAYQVDDEVVIVGFRS